MTASPNDLVADIEARNQFWRRVGAIEHWIELAEADFAETSNPLCVWVMIRYCDKRGVPLPGWVLTYLSEAAAKIQEIAAAEPKKAPDRCLHALGFKRSCGQESPFEDWQRWTRREPACVAFARKICGGAVFKNARADVAREFNVAPSTLDAWLGKFFPGKGREEWPEFFRAELDIEGPRFNKTFAAVMGSFFARSEKTPV
jgi:hypothetical protein